MWFDHVRQACLSDETSTVYCVARDRQIPVPAALRESAASAFGDAGVEWCAGLPGTVAEYVHAWQLTVDLPDGAEPWYGFCGIVVPVLTAEGEQAVLKISWADEETAHEHTALAAWAGNGAVRLLAADGPRRVLLLERLDGDRDLRALAVNDAIAVWGDLMTRLAVPAPTEVDTVAAVATRWADELPRRWRAAAPPHDAALVHNAVELARELSVDGGDRLVHADLHYENVLAATPTTSRWRGQWLAIDPKPMAGNPAFGVLPMLWNRLDELTDDNPEAALRCRLAKLADAAGVDAERARAWSLIRAVETVVWNAEMDMDQQVHRPSWIAETLLRS